MIITYISQIDRYIRHGWRNCEIQSKRNIREDINRNV